MKSIRTKLTAAFVAALLLVVGIGGVSLVQLGAVNGVTREMRDVWLPKLDTLGLLQRSFTARNMLATRRTQAVNFRELAALGQSMRELDFDIEQAEATYQAGIAEGAERDLFASYRQAREDLDRSYAGVVEKLDSGEVTAALEQFRNEAISHFDGTMEALSRLEALAEGGMAIAEQQAQSVYARALVVTGAVALLAGVATIGFIVWVTRHISSPLLRVSDAMRRLTKGDESARIEERADRDDEIGTLIAAAAGYRGSVITARELAQLAETDRQRLDAAISNMPIGLCMFDDRDRLIVCNRKFAEIYRLEPESLLRGTPYAEILEARMQAGTYDGADPASYVGRVTSIVKSRTPTSAIWELKDGRSISTIFQPMKGGWLATHEDITERRRSEEQIRHMARHDALTDLPNRLLFRKRVEEALQSLGRTKAMSVLCLDLDRFKNVNDSLGHSVGDGLLQLVAERLREAVREGDTVARFGGDEFAVVQVDPEQPAAARALAQRLIDSLSAPFIIDGHQVSVGVSIGVALAPADGTDADQLLRSADMALYRSKAEGRGTYRFFEPEMDRRMQERRQLELDMRRALAEGEFCLHYQPVMDLGSNSVASFEALLRWKHPRRGMISPAEFVPLAEEIQLIIPLGEWVLRQACLDAAKWPDDIRIAVNLSPVQFRSKGLVEVVQRALAISGVRPERLELEITEGVLLADNVQTLEMLHKLRNLGVRIAMDDFGTGYSSLGYLQSFPFDKIKIDASFIRSIAADKNSTAIIRAVTGLGQSLGMATTAEGVETKEQLSWVRAEGCTEVQGYLFSEPKPAEDIAALLGRLAKRSFEAA